LYKLKKLKFLDSKKVDDKERKEAQKRGQFCKVAKPDYDKLQQQQLQQQQQQQQMQQLPSNGAASADQPIVLKPLDAASNEPLKQTSDSYFGYTKHVYTGKHSEGNRFIRNDSL